MPLEKKQLLTILEKRKNKNGLLNATSQQRRLRFHTENVSQGKTVRYMNTFMEQVRAVLSDEQTNEFAKLIGFPLDTCKTVDEIYKSLSKVFDGVDPFVNLLFRDGSDLKSDAIEYLSEYFDYPNGLRQRLFNLFKNNTNCVIVVNLPEDSGGDRPKPFFYDVDIDNIVEWDYDDTGAFEYFIYKIDNENYCAIDDYSYRTFTFDGQAVDVSDETVHNIGFCPCNWLWRDKLKDGVTVSSPLSMYLSKLDDLLFDSTNVKFAKLYAAYPVYWSFDADCQFDDGLEYCDGGYLKNKENDDYTSIANGYKKCPKCNTKLGVGSYVKMPFPEEGEPVIKAPVGKLDADVKGIKMLIDNKEKLEREIYVGITNDVYNPTDYEAMNETQVMSLFEGAEQVLMDLQKGFEVIETWLIESMLKIRYDDAFVGYQVSYGSKHYIYSADVLLNSYGKGLEKGFSETILNYIYEKYLEAEYRGNPKGRRRAMFLYELEPFRHYGKDKVVQLFDKQVVDRDEVYLKTNFSQLVARFERENESLESFGAKSERGFNELVNAVDEAIRGYIPEKDSVNNTLS